MHRRGLGAIKLLPFIMKTEKFNILHYFGNRNYDVIVYCIGAYYIKNSLSYSVHLQSCSYHKHVHKYMISYARNGNISSINC